MNKNRIKTHYAWIYLTERCSLHCEYCFFRHRQDRDVMPEAVNQLFSLFENEVTAPSILILSGGEPFLCKERLFEILRETRKRFNKTSLHIQTSGLLIDQSSMEELRALDVSLEFGIDGAFKQTTRHRKGMDDHLFERLVNNIQECVKAGISCGCTMVVHPDEIGDMEKGLNFIQELGINSVDVTPAAFMLWAPQAVSFFKKKYLELIRKSNIRRLFYINDDNDWLEEGTIDLSLHPPGYLLGGDAFLCLPEEKKKEFNLWDISNGKFKPEVLTFYQEAYGDLFKESNSVLYREHLCHSFDLVNKMMGEEYMNSWAINDILRFQTKTHRAVFSKLNSV